MSENSMVSHLGIEFLSFDSNCLRAKMPVDERTKQPFGLLHGGASAALAETVGSVAGNLQLDINKFHCVGVQLSINHLKPVKSGFVWAEAMSLHIGKKTQVWNIDIKNDEQELVASSRLTLAVVEKN
ncbi:MAG: hotdog fold thioesterase [Cytophagales bacterium]